MSLLLMENITKSFFGKKVLSKVNLIVEAGEIHALLGENGAGKTTLMNILYGIYKKDYGDIYLNDNKVNFHSPKDAINYQIGMVHQHFMLVPKFTVLENISLGLKLERHPFTDNNKLNDEILKLVEKYNLDVDPNAKVSTLSVGEQQRVEILKLLYRKAKLLILDEPTAVLTPQEVNSLFHILKVLKEKGHSIIIITHKIPEVINITDKITILRSGEVIKTVNTKDTNPIALSEYMIGRQLNTLNKIHNTNDKFNDFQGLSLKNIDLIENSICKLSCINLNISPGEIIGIAGVDGNGQKELAEVIIGLKKPSVGSIIFNNKRIENSNIRNRKDLGIAYISDDRHHDGLLMSMNIKENLLLNTKLNKTFRKYGIYNNKVIISKTNDIINEYNIKTPNNNSPISYLSGGNQQKLILARELALNPLFIIAFQPTRGLDIGATEFIQQKLIDERNKGSGILLISADLDEIKKLSDWIAVIYKGKIMDIIKNDENIDFMNIGLLMAGHKVEKMKEN